MQISLPCPTNPCAFLFIMPFAGPLVLILWLWERQTLELKVIGKASLNDPCSLPPCSLERLKAWPCLLGTTGQWLPTNMHILIFSFPLCLLPSPKNDPTDFLNLYSSALDDSQLGQCRNHLQPLFKLLFLYIVHSIENTQWPTCFSPSTPSSYLWTHNNGELM